MILFINCVPTDCELRPFQRKEEENVLRPQTQVKDSEALVVVEAKSFIVDQLCLKLRPTISTIMTVSCLQLSFDFIAGLK